MEVRAHRCGALLFAVFCIVDAAVWHGLVVLDHCARLFRGKPLDESVAAVEAADRIETMMDREG